MPFIPMVDLQQQYLHLKEEIDAALQQCLDSSQFIGGKIVQQFEQNLAQYLGCKQVIGCANGTDALQLALMASGLPRGSKIIVPAFTYIAPVEVIHLLGYVPVYADVDPNTFNMTIETIEKVFTEEVKGIIAVHLFGQPCEMESIYSFTQQKKLLLIEDNAQSIGAEKNIQRNSIITTSFFPSKNLAAYGDGGAVMTNDDAMADKIRTIANHGQRDRYYHDTIGINSRLDAMQAAVLDVKLKHLDEFIAGRQRAAAYYDLHLQYIAQLQIPLHTSHHTFHQYTLKVEERYRNKLQSHLAQQNIATAIYYPVPCYKQRAYSGETIFLETTEQLCKSVLSIPVFPEISTDQLSYICNHIKEFFVISAE